MRVDPGSLPDVPGNNVMLLDYKSILLKKLGFLRIQLSLELLRKVIEGNPMIFKDFRALIQCFLSCLIGCAFALFRGIHNMIVAYSYKAY